MYPVRQSVNAPEDARLTFPKGFRYVFGIAFAVSQSLMNCRTKRDGIELNSMAPQTKRSHFKYIAPSAVAILICTILSGIQSVAQQDDADRKLFEQFKAEAEKGDVQFQFKLGAIFSVGQLGVAKDKAEAVKWFREAAKQNLAKAQFLLGLSYDQGDGIAKDSEEAVKWYRKAAEQEFAMAQFALGHCYDKGVGVAKDTLEAVKWYRRAAGQNCVGAQVILGLCYTHGDGVAKDYAEGYKWMLLAAAQGDELAKRTATTLEGMMSREQIAEGQKMARYFNP